MLAIASSSALSSATGASGVGANGLVHSLGTDHTHIDPGHHGLLEISGILRRQLVTARRLPLPLLVAARPRLLRMGNGVLLLMGVVLAAAHSASGSHRATSCSSAARRSSTTACSSPTAAHAGSGVIVQTLTHFPVAIVPSSDAQLGEEPHTSAVEEVAAEVHEERKDYGAGRHYNRLARLGPVHHRVDGSLVFPVCAAGQEIDSREYGVGQANASGKVGVAHLYRVTHYGQIDEHYNRVEHMDHYV